MYFYRRLYIGEKIKHPDLVKWKLRHRAGQLNVYCVLLPETGDMPEIIHSAFLKQPYYRENPPYVIGIAADRQEAYEIVRGMVEEAVRKNGSPNIRNYLFPHGIRRFAWEGEKK